MDHAESPSSRAITPEATQFAYADPKPAPTLPQEIVDNIVDYLFDGSGDESLQPCSLVSRPWVSSCRRYLFHTILFTPTLMKKWVKVFRTPEESPAHYVKDLGFWLGGYDFHGPEAFSRYTPMFANAKALSIMGGLQLLSLRAPLFRELPQAVTYLNLKGTVNFVEAWDFMNRLPNLDDLRLSGQLEYPPTEALCLLPGSGLTLRGGFRGVLKLIYEWAHDRVMDVFLEVPGGIHFTELYVYAEVGSSASIVRLAEACGENLVRLRYSPIQRTSIIFHDRCFDFSKFPNLHEVLLHVKWLFGRLDWIPEALSTFKPATSPRLTKVHLGFDYPLDQIESQNSHDRSELEDLDRELHRIARELARIEREYEGTVNIVVMMGEEFGLFTEVDILQRWYLVSDN